MAVVGQHRRRRQAGCRPAHLHLECQCRAGQGGAGQRRPPGREQGFKRLIAPFDGIVTARETDIGALINVGAAGGAELFVVSETGKLRIYVNVPQNYVPSVPSGTKATISVPEHPGKTYSGTVEASSQAVNPSSGTTLMQIIVDNSAGEMMPGDYASIHLQMAAVANVLSVPSSALIFDARGLSIATVGATTTCCSSRYPSDATWAPSSSSHPASRQPTA